MEVKYALLNGNKYELTSGDENNNNKFSILVGKNGCGKSELIGQIVKGLLRAQVRHETTSIYNDVLDNYLDNEYKKIISQREQDIDLKLSFSNKSKSYDIDYRKTKSARKFINHMGKEEYLSENNYRYKNIFSDVIKGIYINRIDMDINIIAVSMCVFDKFPILQSMRDWNKRNLKYKYLGVANDENRSYKNKSIIQQKTQLLGKSILKVAENEKPIKIDKIFNYLCFDKKVSLFYTLSNKVSSFLSKDESFFENNSTLKSSLGITNLSDDISYKDSIEIEQAIDIVGKYTKSSNLGQSSYFNKIDEINSVVIDFKVKKRERLVEALALLSRLDLVDIHNIEFFKENKGILFYHVSSGQACILINTFCIASEIEDNSLILIDEPELSLHPSWQETFLPLIKSLFNNIVGCHFIIATHSPQIASSLSCENAYVNKMDTLEFIRSTGISKNSIDYQLANIFESPGFKNDYIASEAIKILTLISQKSEISSKTAMRISNIEKFKVNIKKEDPLLSLYRLIDIAKEKYND